MLTVMRDNMIELGTIDKTTETREDRQVLHWLIVAVAFGVGIGIAALLMLPGALGF